MSNEEKLIWAAGLFDGEGMVHIGISGHLRLSIEMTHEAGVRQFYRIAGCGNLSDRLRGIKNKRTWTCTIQGKEAVDLARKLQPYILVKSQQIKLAIQYGEECLCELQYQIGIRGRLATPDSVRTARQLIRDQLQYLNQRGL